MQSSLLLDKTATSLKVGGSDKDGEHQQRQIKLCIDKSFNRYFKVRRMNEDANLLFLLAADYLKPMDEFIVALTKEVSRF